MSSKGAVVFALVALALPTATGVSAPPADFPVGTYLGKTTAADLRASGDSVQIPPPLYGDPRKRVVCVLRR
jgi:hypothetical protein